MIRPELLDEAIGELPASTVDIGAIVVRHERRKALRRAGAVLLGTGALAVTVVAGMGALRPPPGVVAPTTEPALTSASPSPVPESAEAKAARVQAAWLRATTRVLPAARWRAGHHGSHEKPSRGDYFDSVAGPTAPAMFTRTNNVNGRPAIDPQGNPLDPSLWPTSDALYHTFGIVKLGANEGRFNFRTLWRASPNYMPSSRCLTGSDGVMTCSDDYNCASHAVCERSEGPNGEVIVVTRESQRFKEFKLPYMGMWVWVRSADGTRTIEMSIENRAGGDLGPAPATTELALTQEQVLQILFEPGLMI